MSIDIIKSIWPEWEIDDTPLGKGSYGTVYRAVKSDRGVVRESAIKLISIPQDDTDYDTLRPRSVWENDSEASLEGIVRDFVGEIRIMESMKGTKNIVSVDDYKVVERKDRFGWDILIRMELLTPLTKAYSSKQVTEAEAIRLGTDIASALDICGRKNILHRDIKPQNIFISEFGDFKLGDFGMAKTLESTAGSLSLRGTPKYIAPEAARGEPYGAGADIYSLGLVLYTCMNRGRLPFLDVNKQLLLPTEREEANRRRLAGEPLPPPISASPELAEIILKACSPDPADRYSSPAELKAALISIAGRAVPRKNSPANGANTSAGKSAVSPGSGKKKPGKKAVIAIAAGAVLLLALAAVIFFVLKDRISPADHVDAGVTSAPSEAVPTELPEVTGKPGAEPTAGAAGNPADDADHSEAYAAYLSHLQRNKASIDNYLWQKGYSFLTDIELTDEVLARPVSITDIWGDETPELIYIYGDAEGMPYRNSYLSIVTYMDGEIKYLYDSDWDDDGWPISYEFFRTSENKNLRVYWHGGDDLTRYFWIEYLPTDDGLTAKTLCCKTVPDYDDEPPVFRDSFGNSITEARYDEIVSEITAHMNEVVMFGSVRIPYAIANGESYSYFDTQGCSAMTADEAIARLRELIGDNEVSAYGPLSKDEFLAIIPNLPMTLSDGFGRYSDWIYLNADATISASFGFEDEDEDSEYDSVVRYNSFTFSLGDLRMENEYTISFTVTDLTYGTAPGTETVVTENGRRTLRIAIESSTFKEGYRCLLYLPGADVDCLDPDFVKDFGIRQLNEYVIYCIDKKHYYFEN